MAKKIRTAEPQQKFTGSYKKKSVSIISIKYVWLNSTRAHKFDG